MAKLIMMLLVVALVAGLVIGEAPFSWGVPRKPTPAKDGNGPYHWGSPVKTNQTQQQEGDAPYSWGTPGHANQTEDSYHWGSPVHANQSQHDGQPGKEEQEN
jgi:hypothetical protein